MQFMFAKLSSMRENPKAGGRGEMKKDCQKRDENSVVDCQYLHPSL